MVIDKTLRERFDALPAKARDAILDKRRDYDVEWDCVWWDSIYDDFVEKVNELGIEITPRVVRLVSGKTRDEPNIQFSGFCSQGDGASFAGYIPRSKMQQHLAGFPLLLQYFDDIDLHVSWASRDSHYCHKHTLSFDVEYSPPFNEDGMDGLRLRAAEQTNIEVSREIEAFETAVKDKVHGLCDELYNDLQAEYDHLTSDDHVLERLLEDEDEMEELLKEHEDDCDEDPV